MGRPLLNTISVESSLPNATRSWFTSESITAIGAIPPRGEAPDLGHRDPGF
jgi:hypothetical protein